MVVTEQNTYFECSGLLKSIWYKLIIYSVLRKEDNLSGAEDHYQFWKNPLKDLCLLCDKDKITSDNTCQSTDLSEMVLKQQIIISQELEEEEKRNIELFKKFGISSETWLCLSN